MFHPVLTILPCAAAVPSLLLPSDAPVFFYDCEGGIASLSPRVTCSVPHPLSSQLWVYGDRNCVGSLVPGPLGTGSSRVGVQPNRKVVSEMRTELLAPWAWRQPVQAQTACAATISCRYSSSMKSLSNKFVHLTNYSVNKKNTEYKSNLDETACQGHKW